MIATIVKMLKALREATGNVAASDAFMEAFEEREAQREQEAREREAQREQEAREREAQREARSEKFLAAMQQQMQRNAAAMHREIKTTNRWLTVIGLLIALLAVAIAFSNLG